MKNKYHPIRIFLEVNGIKRRDFIKVVGIKHLSQLNAYLNPSKSGRYPSPQLAKKIEEITNGEILAREIINPRFVL
jgi:hypothetical protein